MSKQVAARGQRT